MRLHFILSTTLVLIMGMTCSLQAGTVLYDDFEDGVIDSSLWVELEGTPTDAAEITESGGALQIATVGVDRSYLVTAGEWDPANGTVTVTGTVNMPNGSFEIWMRASDSYDSLAKPNGTGVLGSGLQVGNWLGADESGYTNLSGLVKVDTVWPWSGFGSETVTPITGSEDTSWEFVVVDDGTSITATWTEVGDPTNVGVFKGDSSFDEGSYHVAFSGTFCEITDVTITQVPEPSTFALLMALAGSVIVLRRRYR